MQLENHQLTGKTQRKPSGVIHCAYLHLRPAAEVEEGGMEDREEGRQEERKWWEGKREIERQREEVGGREGDGDVKRREYKE